MAFSPEQHKGSSSQVRACRCRLTLPLDPSGPERKASAGPHRNQARHVPWLFLAAPGFIFSDFPEHSIAPHLCCGMENALKLRHMNFCPSHPVALRRFLACDAAHLGAFQNFWFGYSLFKIDSERCP
ncbi:hypothetical protein ACT6QG_08325 [Xanthobacter sp. TB0136]|uniref:hypothetical protein n=1 Tax=Xanthobacter sp. TB0136 TaxID=3459177 RepID=UPI0040393D74